MKFQVRSYDYYYKEPNNQFFYYVDETIDAESIEIFDNFISFYDNEDKIIACFNPKQVFVKKYNFQT